MSTLAHLQSIQDQVLVGAAASRVDHWGNYRFRGLVTHRGSCMIVQVGIDRFRTPLTLYPISGDNVTMLGDRRTISVPLNMDDLLRWEA